MASRYGVAMSRNNYRTDQKNMQDKTRRGKNAAVMISEIMNTPLLFRPYGTHLQ